MRRDEVSRLEAAVRDANPLPHADDLIDSDEATAVTLLVEQRRRTMTATPTQPTPQPIGPPPRHRRSMAWAFAAGFVVILLLVGAATVVLRGDRTPVADEPAPPPTTISPVVDEPATPPTTISPEATAIDGWQEVATGEVWAGSIGDVEALPGGGYVATVRSTVDVRAAEAAGPDVSSVMWSPNGVDWFDGDPQRNVPHVPDLPFTFLTPQIAVAGDAVFVLDTEFDGQTPWVTDIELWMGDPKSGIWDRLDLDVGAIDGHLVGTTHLASNGHEVLVSAYVAIGDRADLEEGLDTEIAVWTIDPPERSYLRTSVPNALTLFDCRDDDLPCPGGLAADQGSLVAWVDERWIHFASANDSDSGRVKPRDTLWTSGDGLSWSEITLPTGMNGIHSIAAGSSGVVAANCGDPSDRIWFSPDGLEWTFVPGAVFHNAVVASWGERGFVTMADVVAPDGSGVRQMPFPFGGPVLAAASGDTLLAWAGGLWLYQDVNG